MTTAVNYDTVTQAAGDVSLTASQLSQKLEDLMAEVNRVASNWEGAAKEAYRESQDRLTRDMAGMNQDLVRIAQLLQESVVGYQDTDKGNAARFRMMM
ncbi:MULTISPECIES: WXG100 family type VII secretion target [Streptomyces]|uniref:ESAT-6-like protein n=1 Tax=Streptomyces lateritius TaxID=67313 RepID=A0ABW6YI56_9ACTN|nr:MULTISPECIES: WXG100 family type VII secretion target [Streptomyces]QGZ51333.1 WXG100 family type VII secretion target [Streptomyces sp. QHH-9511]GGU04718.1 ESAT-6-like protein [Streptomyces lateritius]